MNGIIEYVISDYCLYSSIATDASSLFANSKVGIREEVKDEIIEAVNDISITKTYSSCPIPELDDSDITTRVLHMLLKSLVPFIDKILEKDFSSTIHLHFILPEEYSHRRQFINLDRLSDILNIIYNFNLPFTVTASDIEEGGIKSLKECCGSYLKNENDVLVFGALDSLINKATVIEYLNKNKLLLNDNAQGVSPAEAAAFVAIKRVTDSAVSESTPSLVRITGISESQKFKTSNAASNQNVLLNAIQSALQQASVSSENIRNIIYSSNVSMSKSVEWHNILKKLWPNILPEQLRVAVELGEIESADNPNPYTVDTFSCQSSLGECGAANLVLELILSIGKIQYDLALQRYGLAEISPLLVCNSHEKGISGAICLQV